MGTMLVYATVDYKEALHHALATERLARLKSQNVSNVPQAEGVHASEPNQRTMLHYLGSALNKTLVSQAKTITGTLAVMYKT